MGSVEGTWSVCEWYNSLRLCAMHVQWGGPAPCGFEWSEQIATDWFDGLKMLLPTVVFGAAALGQYAFCQGSTTKRLGCRKPGGEVYKVHYKTQVFQIIWCSRFPISLGALVLQEDFLLWAGDMGRFEPSQVARLLGLQHFPALVLLQPLANDWHANLFVAQRAPNTFEGQTFLPLKSFWMIVLTKPGWCIWPRCADR